MTRGLRLSFVIFMASVAFGKDGYQGTRFCEKDTTFVEESAKTEAYSQISSDRADRENAHIIQVPGENIKLNSSNAVVSLCQGTTALKTIKVTLIAYDPAFEAGISIDKAASYRNNLKGEYRKLAQSYFSVSSRTPQLVRCESHPYFDHVVSGDHYVYNFIHTNGGYFGVYLLKQEDFDPAEALQKFRQTKVNVNSGASKMERAQVLVLKLKGNWASVLVPPSLIRKLYFDDSSSRLLTFEPFSHFVQSATYALVDSQKMQFWEGMDEKSIRLTPLSAACVGDACVLRQMFLFSDLPDSFQKQTLKLRHLLAKDSTTHRWSIEAASRDADAIWDAYMTHFTTVREVQVPEDKLTKYEVELDLEPVCRYALPRKDMLAR